MHGYVLLTSLLMITLIAVGASAGSVNIEKTKYSTYGNCLKLSNGTVDVLVTLDLGPRVIYYGFAGGENTFAELGPDTVVKSELGEWHPWGGHRLWHAPEASPRRYVLDDVPVKVAVLQSGYRLMAAIPWSQLGGKPASGQFGLDFSINFSDPAGQRNVARLHWGRNGAAVVYDLPTEARLEPATWGVGILER